MCILHIGVHEVHEIWKPPKTSPAAQRTETFVKQGFKNMFVKVFYKNLTISQQKWQLNLTITIFTQKYPNLPQKPYLCNKQALTIVKIINLNINTQQRCP